MGEKSRQRRARDCAGQETMRDDSVFFRFVEFSGNCGSGGIPCSQKDDFIEACSLYLMRCVYSDKRSGVV